MAERLDDIVRKIQDARQLEAVVTAMRSIAGSRAQKGRSLLAGIEAYTEVVSRAIGHALSLLPLDALTPPFRDRGKLCLILFCAEQGFAGAFSERVLDAASSDHVDAVNLIIGTRGWVVASDRGIKAAQSFAMATQVEAIPGFANKLAEALYSYIASGIISKVDVVSSRSTSGGGIVIDRHSLLPIDFRRFGQPLRSQAPLTTLRPEVLLERLAAEYIFAQLCQATMHAFEAENEARMLSMASAKTNIEAKLATLTQRERQLRQENITTEIVELAAGAEASWSGRK